MSERTLFPEWRDQTRHVRYPFTDGATLTTTGGKVLPADVFVDASFYVPGAGAGLFLSRVDVTHEAVTLTVGDPSERALATGTFPLADVPDAVAFADAAGRAAGLLVSEQGRPAVLGSWGVGTHEFRPGATPFVPAVCVPTPAAGLAGVRLPTGEVLTGDVWLVGGAGVVLTPVDVGTAGGVRAGVRVDVVGDPLFRRRLCSPGALFATPKFVTTVRVVAPNQSFDCRPGDGGEFPLTVAADRTPDTVLRVTPTAAGVRIGVVGASPVG
jgi:hypothetical protein